MDLDIDLFKIQRNNIEPSQGKVLISEPFLQDYYFKRSVVLLTEHTKDGTLGLVLNKPLDISINEVIKDFPTFKNAHVLLGGPVSTERVFYLHTLGEAIPGSVHIFDEVYWGGDFDILKILIESGSVNNDQIRFFVGYSGWSAGQLDNELSKNSWVVTQLSQEEIMNKGSQQIWTDSLHKLGSRYKVWTNSPENPSLN